MSRHIQSSFQEAYDLLHRFIGNRENISSIESAIKLFVSSLKSKNQIFAFGNGGSMCDALHFTEELTGRYRKNRDPLPAMSASNPGHITCVANDYGFDEIFSRQLRAFGKSGDSLLAISTSGNSENIIKSVIAAKNLGIHTIGLLGKTGGKLKDIVDQPIIVPSHTTDRIQEIHIKIIHIFIEGIERELFPELY